MRKPSNAGRKSAGPRSKKAIEEQRILVFADQSGFYLLPLVLGTYAPVGQTPVIKEYPGHDHLSAMSGITPEGKLYMTVQERSYKGPDMVKFLRRDSPDTDAQSSGDIILASSGSDPFQSFVSI